MAEGKAEMKLLTNSDQNYLKKQICGFSALHMQQMAWYKLF